MFDVFLTLLFLVAIYAFLRFRPAYGFYAVASIVVPLCFIFPGRPLLSMPRFLAVVFPMIASYLLSRTLVPSLARKLMEHESLEHGRPGLFGRFRNLEKAHLLAPGAARGA